MVNINLSYIANSNFEWRIYLLITRACEHIIIFTLFRSVSHNIFWKHDVLAFWTLFFEKESNLIRYEVFLFLCIQETPSSKSIAYLFVKWSLRIQKGYSYSLLLLETGIVKVIRWLHCWSNLVWYGLWPCTLNHLILVCGDSSGWIRLLTEQTCLRPIE